MPESAHHGDEPHDADGMDASNGDGGAVDSIEHPAAAAENGGSASRSPVQKKERVRSVERTRSDDRHAKHRDAKSSDDDRAAASEDTGATTVYCVGFPDDLRER